MAGTTSTRAWLEWANGDAVPIEGNCGLGRSRASTIVLPDERVSRRHATIHAQDDGEFWLVDLGSANGTYVNGRRVVQPVLLHDHDLIQIGPFELRFRQPAAAGRESSDTGGAGVTVVDIKAQPCWLLVTDMVGSTRLAQSLAPEEMAVVIGRWISACKEVVEAHAGNINKYLGDGFLAYWPRVGPVEPRVVETLEALRTLQEKAGPPFRLALHQGRVFCGGVASLGEENLSGPEVNFVFRMEKLAGGLGIARLASQPAAELLRERLALEQVGEHALPGFDGTHPFYSF